MLARTAAVFFFSVLAGSIPWAYIIVRSVTGEDITEHGSGNVGAMNVRRTTGSWGWFAVAVLADGSKGAIPTAAAKLLIAGVPVLTPAAEAGSSALVVQAAVVGAVVGHNYSLWLAVKRRRLTRTGKGLAAGAGALLAYDVRYFAVVIIVGLLALAATRIMLVGQVAAAVSLPIAAAAFGSPDVAFAAAVATVVLVAHARRLRGLLRGEEPAMYVHDGPGPRG